MKDVKGHKKIKKNKDVDHIFIGNKKLIHCVNLFEAKKLFLIEKNQKNNDTIKIRKYTVLDTLGEGKWGKVLKVKNNLNNKEYALKIPLQDQSFEAELTCQIELRGGNYEKFITDPQYRREIKKIKLTGIVELPLHAHVGGDKAFLMNLCDGSLEQFCKEPVKFENVVSMISQLLIGISTIHENGYIHHDLAGRPDNILFKKNGSDLYLKSDFNPNEKNEFKNCYVLANFNRISEENPTLYYFDNQGKRETVTINDRNHFNLNLKKICEHKQDKRIFLSSEQVNSLITSNGGHTQPPSFYIADFGLSKKGQFFEYDISNIGTILFIYLCNVQKNDGEDLPDFQIKLNPLIVPNYELIDNMISCIEKNEKYNKYKPIFYFLKKILNHEYKNGMECLKAWEELTKENNIFPNIPSTSNTKHENNKDISNDNNKVEIIKKLEAYIKKVNPNNQDAIEQIDFKKGFHIAKNSQAKSREANYLLAKDMLKRLENGESLNDVFPKKTDIENKRRELLGESKFKKLSFFGKNKIRGGLREILDDVQKITGNKLK